MALILVSDLRVSVCYHDVFRLRQDEVDGNLAATASTFPKDSDLVQSTNTKLSGTPITTKHLSASTSDVTNSTLLNCPFTVILRRTKTGSTSLETGIRASNRETHTIIKVEDGMVPDSTKFTKGDGKKKILLGHRIDLVQEHIPEDACWFTVWRDPGERIFSFMQMGREWKNVQNPIDICLYFIRLEKAFAKSWCSWSLGPRLIVNYQKNKTSLHKDIQRHLGYFGIQYPDQMEETNSDHINRTVAVADFKNCYMEFAEAGGAIRDHC